MVERRYKPVGWEGNALLLVQQEQRPGWEDGRTKRSLLTQAPK